MFFEKLNEVISILYRSQSNIINLETAINKLNSLKTKNENNELQFICDILLYFFYYKLAKITGNYSDYKNADFFYKQKLKKRNIANKNKQFLYKIYFKTILELINNKYYEQANFALEHLNQIFELVKDDLFFTSLTTMIQEELFLRKKYNLSYFYFSLSNNDMLLVDFKDISCKEQVFNKYITPNIEEVQNFNKLSNFLTLPLFPEQKENKEVYKLIFEFLLDMEEKEREKNGF